MDSGFLRCDEHLERWVGGRRCDCAGEGEGEDADDDPAEDKDEDGLRSNRPRGADNSENAAED